MKFKLEAVTKLIPYIRLVERERLRVPVNERRGVPALFCTVTSSKRLFDETIVEKLAIGQILSLLRESPSPRGEIAESLGLTPSEVSKHLNTSSDHGLGRYDESKRYALS